MMDTVQIGREKLRRLVPRAVDVLDDEMDGEKRRLDAAKEVLDRAGLSGITRHDVTSGGKVLPVREVVVKLNEPVDD